MSLICSVPILSAILTMCGDPAPFASGYVEGDYTMVAPVEVAQIAEVAVSKGDVLEAGTVLVTMQQQDAEIALAQAEAQLSQAESALANLLEGARPEEIEVIEASLASARTQAVEAERTRDRIIKLAERGATTTARRDDAVSAADVAQAKVAEIEANLAVAKLAARPQAIAQAEANVRAAQAARAQAAWRLDQRILVLPEAVKVVDILRHRGEIAGPSAPVLSVLAEGSVKLSLYVPEPSFSQIAVGDELRVNCDGCDPDTVATITYISNEPEFTPPVIYSLENRQKLVYLVEAQPSGAHLLKPGQIVDVALPVDASAEDTE